MATSDLCEVLKRHAPASPSPQSQANPQTHTLSPTIDTRTEKSICYAVLILLRDDNNDVQTVAVKTLVVLFTSVSEEQILKIAVQLGSLVLNPTECKLKDVYTDGLRKLLKTVPVNMGDNVGMKLVAELIDGVRKNLVMVGEASTAEDRGREKIAEDITVSCLEIMSDMLARFRGLFRITQQHENIARVVKRSFLRRVVRCVSVPVLFLDVFPVSYPITYSTG